MATTTHREIERKYEATRTTKVPNWSGLFGDVKPVAEDQVLAATYLDTADLRLAGAKITLRFRTGDDEAGWHLKLPAGKDTRDEIQIPQQGAGQPDLERGPPAELADLLRSITRGAPVGPIATLRTARRLLRWTDPTGRELLAVTDDRVTARVLSSGDESAWREIEIELGVDGDLKFFERAESRLRKAGVRRSASASKLARALGDQAPIAVAEPGRKARAGEAVTSYVAAQLAAIRRYDIEVRRDTEDAVHQMRVATRRARSALQAYGRVIERDLTRALTDELKWLAGVLGAARDLEVLRDRVLAVAASQPAENVLGPVQARIEKWFAPRQAQARSELLTALASDRYLALLDDLASLVADPPLTRLARKPAATVLPRELDRSFRRVRRHLRAASPGGAGRDVELHQARKAGKRLRYAAEAARPVLGKPAHRVVKRTKVLQEVLGEHQDAVVAAPVLRDLAIVAYGAGETSFTYGVLFGLETATEINEAALTKIWGALSAAAAKSRP